MLTVQSIMGAMGTCDAPNYDHRNGALFTSDGAPAYCQIMSMHWNVSDRETVECDGGACPATAGECSGEAITYHGHEVVAEVREFLQFPTHSLPSVRPSMRTKTPSRIRVGPFSTTKDETVTT